MPTALISVSDKRGVGEFARSLQAAGWTVVSTGGTARALREEGIPVTEVAEITGHPEIMEGRVKTLHPAVHAGLLGRRDHPTDTQQMDTLGYGPIDLVAVNLYPFRETVARADVTFAEAIENIDIGGPAMIRASAKNHEHVWVVVDPADYAEVLEAIRPGAVGGEDLRRELARRAFAHTASYDAAITEYLTGASEASARDGGEEAGLPESLRLDLRRVQSLRYGENPNQRAAFYSDGSEAGLPKLRQLQGKELSFNNLLDVDAALLAVRPWPAEEPACAIIKHTTPCGLGVGASPASAYARALATDATSAFGSVIAFNVPLDAETAELIRPNFVEAVVAPAITRGARGVLESKKNLRLIEVEAEEDSDGGLDFKRVLGGFLLQDRLSLAFPEAEWRVVTARAPDEREWADLRFAWRAVAAVKSNAILLSRDGAAIGIGAGQMSRVDSSRLAVQKATDNGFDLEGAALASDAFFPFRDGVDAAASAGIRAIIQPGGSVRDPEVIAAADEHGIAMVFTDRRLFRH